MRTMDPPAAEAAFSCVNRGKGLSNRKTPRQENICTPAVSRALTVSCAFIWRRPHERIWSKPRLSTCTIISANQRGSEGPWARRAVQMETQRSNYYNAFLLHKTAGVLFTRLFIHPQLRAPAKSMRSKFPGKGADLTFLGFLIYPSLWETSWLFG